MHRYSGICQVIRARSPAQSRERRQLTARIRSKLREVLVFTLLSLSFVGFLFCLFLCFTVCPRILSQSAFPVLSLARCFKCDIIGLDVGSSVCVVKRLHKTSSQQP